ncbi:MAG: hypothetical protein FWG66_08235, partial [Spirochaetes bacterium]|nr:hypothetical protein [Spirochaetota bacterium]
MTIFVKNAMLLLGYAWGKAQTRDSRAKPMYAASGCIASGEFCRKGEKTVLYAQSLSANLDNSVIIAPP